MVYMRIKKIRLGGENPPYMSYMRINKLVIANGSENQN
jgi:hypothetical protein